MKLTKRLIGVQEAARAAPLLASGELSCHAYRLERLGHVVKVVLHGAGLARTDEISHFLMIER